MTLTNKRYFRKRIRITFLGEERNELRYRKSKNPQLLEALRELEKTVERLSEGDTKLDELLKLYEEGIAYLNHCQSRLGEAEARMKILSAQIQTPGKTEENNG